jgi:hypothetical protein
VFHVELRQFPHSACAFNLSEPELRAIVEPWSREQWIELGERKWNPHQARLTVLEGPRLPVEALAIGRGWRNAQHRSEDVTERVLAQAIASRQEAGMAGAGASAAEDPPADADGRVPDGGFAPDGPAPGAPGAELQSLLGPDPAALLQAWRLAAERRPELSPSESLALAEATLRSLDAPPS